MLVFFPVIHDDRRYILEEEGVWDFVYLFACFPYFWGRPEKGKEVQTATLSTFRSLTQIVSYTLDRIAYSTRCCLEDL